MCSSISHIKTLRGPNPDRRGHVLLGELSGPFANFFVLSLHVVPIRHQNRQRRRISPENQLIRLSFSHCKQDVYTGTTTSCRFDKRNTPSPSSALKKETAVSTHLKNPRVPLSFLVDRQQIIGTDDVGRGRQRDVIAVPKGRRSSPRDHFFDIRVDALREVHVEGVAGIARSASQLQAQVGRAVLHRPSPRVLRKEGMSDGLAEHASVMIKANVPLPGVEFCLRALVLFQSCLCDSRVTSKFVLVGLTARALRRSGRGLLFRHCTGIFVSRRVLPGKCTGRERIFFHNVLAKMKVR